MTTFTKWFLLVAVTGTGLFFAEAKGAISLIIQNDKSFLALLIMLLFVVMTVRVGQLSFQSDVAKDDERKELNKKAEQQSLAKYGLDFVTDTYLPEKLTELGLA